MDLFTTTGLRCLVACETSGRIRDALLARGHDAVSCDLLPSKAPGPHLVQDVRPLLQERWDVVVAHPPCPLLTIAALWCLYHPEDEHLPMDQRRPHPKFPNRRQEQDEAAQFFMDCVNANARWTWVENPVGIMASRYREASFSLQPYQFGHDASKRTCWWVRGPRGPVSEQLVRLPPRHLWHPGRWVVHEGRRVQRWANQTDSGQNRLPPSDSRWAARSETYPGIADGIADAIGIYFS